MAFVNVFSHQLASHLDFSQATSKSTDAVRLCPASFFGFSTRSQGATFYWLTGMYNPLLTDSSLQTQGLFPIPPPWKLVWTCRLECHSHPTPPHYTAMRSPILHLNVLVTQLNPHQTVCWWYVTVYVCDPIHLSGNACKRGSMAIASPNIANTQEEKMGKKRKAKHMLVMEPRF